MHEVLSVVSDFDLVDYIANHEADQSELDIFADFHHRSPVDNMSMDSTQMLVDSANSQDEQGYSPSQQLHHHSQQSQQQQQHQQQHRQQSLSQHTRPQLQPSHMMTAEMLDLKDRLEQQMKLQQLQQLLLQQQIDLLNGSSQSPTQHLGSTHQKDDMFGLLTPGPSTELPAMVPKELVPPMMLQSDMFLGSPATALTANPHELPIINPNPSFSAPAALAFPTASPYPLPIDFSPISSPWIHPHNSQSQHAVDSQPLLPLPLHPNNQQTPGHALHPNIPRSHLKRVGSVDDHMVDHHPRKRSLRTTPPSSASTPMTLPIPNSASSSTYYYPSNDTPSPVDLSMTALQPSTSNASSPPNSNFSDPAISSNNNGNSDLSTVPPPPSTPIAPMTPASILNLRRFSTGLASSSHLPATSNKNSLPPPANDLKETPNKKPNVGKVKTSLPSSNVTGRGRKGSAATLKPLLPGTAQPPTPTSPLSLPANSSATASSVTGAPRKSSHKVAEQKRRDSLKTSFDELRLLLPPVALPEDEELLPGCMPPRGPPKGDADGPNRGVSKLALLRCGNAYIKELKGMVQRRDDEILALRNEIRRMRLVARDHQDDNDDADDTSKFDLDRDVDEGRQIEAGIRLGMKAGALSSVQEEGDDDD